MGWSDQLYSDKSGRLKAPKGKAKMGSLRPRRETPGLEKRRLASHVFQESIEPMKKTTAKFLVGAYLTLVAVGTL